jgi:hypothetical protein
MKSKLYRVNGRISIDVSHEFEAMDDRDAEEQIEMWSTWNYESLVDFMKVRGCYDVDFDEAEPVKKKLEQQKRETKNG